MLPKAVEQRGQKTKEDIRRKIQAASAEYDELLTLVKQKGHDGHNSLT